MKKALLLPTVFLVLLVCACNQDKKGSNKDNNKDIALESSAICACDQNSKNDKELSMKTDNEKFSYLVGVNTAQSLKAIPMQIDREFFKKGLIDELEGKTLALSEEEMTRVREAATKELQEKQMKAFEEMKEKNLKEARQFLETNKKNSKVKETASGLQYEILKEGKGENPTKESTVKVHYKGTTIDGIEFDSSYKRNEPIEFPLQGVIAGWTEGVQLMNKGSKFKFYIKPELAYGENGTGGIEPNSLLIFEIELLDFR